MKLLLDENLPKKLKNDFPDHEVYTVRGMGWDGKTNGELLKLMLAAEFDVLLTFDKNLQHQQNFKKYTLTVFVLSAPDNTYLTLQKLVPQIVKLLSTPLPGGPVEISL
jgi:predicted nuclease of predicted toxin-antitoxin system